MKNLKDYPTTKEIINLLGMGVLLGSTLIFPGVGYIASTVSKAKRKHEWERAQKEWKKFNPYLLKRNLKQLQKQKIVEIIYQDNQEVIKLTELGHTRYLRYKLEEIHLGIQSWDKKWRLIIYDIASLKKAQQEQFRRILKKMNLMMLQKSVYLTPYPCLNEITYLREYFNLSEEVIIIEVNGIENEQLYKQYFGI